MSASSDRQHWDLPKPNLTTSKLQLFQDFPIYYHPNFIREETKPPPMTPWTTVMIVQVIVRMTTPMIPKTTAQHLPNWHLSIPTTWTFLTIYSMIAAKKINIQSKKKLLQVMFNFNEFHDSFNTRWCFAEFLLTRKKHEKIREILFTFKLHSTELLSF